jgi:hypothetical protein
MYTIALIFLDAVAIIVAWTKQKIISTVGISAIGGYIVVKYLMNNYVYHDFRRTYLQLQK